MGKARVLTLDEAIQWGRKSVWLQLRNATCSLEMKYALEHPPFLRFRDDKLKLEIEVRGEYYGKTWRCFDQCPVYEEEYPWDDGEEWLFTEADAV